MQRKKFSLEFTLQAVTLVRDRCLDGGPATRGFGYRSFAAALHCLDWALETMILSA